jgi:hypothetical protein
MWSECIIEHKNRRPFDHNGEHDVDYDQATLKYTYVQNTIYPRTILTESLAAWPVWSRGYLPLILPRYPVKIAASQSARPATASWPSQPPTFCSQLNRFPSSWELRVAAGFCLVQCSAVQCNAVQCYAVQCYAVQCYAVQCYAVQCSAVQFVHSSPLALNTPVSVAHAQEVLPK